MIPGFSTRLGWERGWRYCMANSKDWRSKNVNVIELNCKVVKKWQPPISTSIPPLFFRFIPRFLQKILYPPPSDSIFWRSYPPPLLRGFPTMRGEGEWGHRISRNIKKKIECRNYRVQQKNKWNFYRWSRKNPMGLLFWSLKFQLVWHNFVEFPGIKLHSVRIFQGENNKSKTIETLTEFRKKIHK